MTACRNTGGYLGEKMKTQIDLRNVPVGTKCKLRNGDTAVILAVLDNPLSEWEAVIGYHQYQYNGYQTNCQWYIDGVWNDRSNPKCRGMDIVKILPQKSNEIDKWLQRYRNLNRK